MTEKSSLADSLQVENGNEDDNASVGWLGWQLIQQWEIFRGPPNANWIALSVSHHSDW